MNTSLVNREIAVEDVRKKGFSYYFILIRNDNFHYQVLSEKYENRN
nr:hypothetical protein LKV13_04665 [Borrelia sp. BU AG58]